MAKPIQIGAYTFKSRKAAMDYVRAIRDRHEDGETLLGEDDTFLRELINLHSDKDEKIDAGITRFTVGKDRKWGTTRCFYLVRKDGTDTDFSFDNCINGKNPKRDVIDGFRAAIADQVIAFKIGQLASCADAICPIDGSPLTKETVDVDHIPPQTFDSLVKGWLIQNNLTALEVHLVPNADNQWVRTLRDQHVILSWQKYHSEHSKLRLISRNANRSKKGH